MADKNTNLSDTLSDLFDGISGIIDAKTVVGEPKIINDVIIIPLMDVSFGMAGGSFNKNTKNNDMGGANAKITPSAVLIIQNGITKLVNVKHQDFFVKLLDLIPEMTNKIKENKSISKEDIDYAKEYIEEIDNK